MTWTGIARREHRRKGLRYSGDMTDREWVLTSPFIPPAKSGGRKRTSDMREVLNAVRHVASNGCAWRTLPKCVPPASTVRRCFHARHNAGLFECINTLLIMNSREIEGREASPSAGVIDSQNVKITESGRVCGFDAGKKVKGRKRHILTDTCGYLTFIVGHGDWRTEIIKRSDTAKGFVLLPRRWVVERTFAWARAAQASRQGLGNIHRVINHMGAHRLYPDAAAQNCKVLLRLRNC